MAVGFSSGKSSTQMSRDGFVTEHDFSRAEDAAK
jgi:hypothetical protein